MLLIGMDEAGYGPQLGPLCHGYCALRCPDGADGAPDLYALLHPAVMRHPAEPGRLTVDDSKKIYSRAAGLGLLRRGVTAFLNCLGPPSPPGDLYQGLLPAADRAQLEADPWGLAQEPPGDEGEDFGAAQGLFLSEALQRNGIRVLAFGGRSLSARHFNAALRSTQNKAEVSWSVIHAQCGALLPLAAQGERVHVVIDRQGGRKFYAAHLARLFPGCMPWVEQENARESSYKIDAHGSAVRVTFVVEADGQDLTVALGSMAAKLVRELCMQRLNAFFRRFNKRLKPTAGYYGDAHRFLSQTRAVRRKLGIPDETLIREK